ncbi:hypothetical protein Tco_1081755 [Tanacetum coccineum]|uniref:Uncharacterized protein n=1 Tax=Tanacetum coccineum TaxID=301880 RepID=A0ABQ5HZZ0_9ASTR
MSYQAMWDMAYWGFLGVRTTVDIFWNIRTDTLITHSKDIRCIHQGRYGVSVPAFTKDHKGIKLNTPYPEDLNMPYWKYGMNIIFWKISSVIRVDDDLYDLRSMEAEFPVIVIDDAFTPQDALPCKS